jgi:hypothetical protein
MNAYKLNRIDGIKKVKSILNLSCQYKITNKIVDEVLIQIIFNLRFKY